jgi:glycine cleavage system H lipoate-binding protein
MHAVSGKIVEVNNELDESPKLLNQDHMAEDGWQWSA